MVIASYRRRRLIPTPNAAARLRRSVNRAAYAGCARCGHAFDPSRVEIDHVHALALGGEDIEGNVQVLCVPCHRDKTRKEFYAAAG